jgi:PST family polysaccharide transporter
LVAGNAGWLAAEQVLRLVLSTVAAGMMGRTLGPTGYGVLSEAQNWMLILIPLAHLGFNETIVRLVLEEDDSSRIIGTAIQLRLLAGFLTASIAYAVVTQIGSKDPNNLLGLLLLALPCQAPLILEQLFQSKLESRTVVIYRGTALILSSLIRIALAIQSTSISWFAVSLLLDYALVAVALIIALPKHARKEILTSYSSKAARKLLRISCPLILSGLLIVIYFRAEQLVIGEVLGNTALGLYAAASRIAGIPSIFASALLASLLPVIIQRAQQRAGQTNGAPSVPKEIKILLEVMTLAGYIIALAVALLGPLVTVWLFGATYDDARLITIILALNAPTLLSGAVRSQFILIQGCTWVHIWSGIIGVAFNVGLAMLLITKFGLAGAATASVVSAFVSAVLTSLFFEPLRAFGALQLNAMLLPLNWSRILALLKEIKMYGLYPLLR